MADENKIIKEGVEIRTLEEACNWLRDAWMYEPYNIYYEEYGDTGYIDIEPSRGNPGATGWTINSLEEFKTFIENN